MLFSCLYYFLEKKNKIDSDINIKNIDNKQSGEFKLFIKPKTKQSIFYSYHKIGLVINTVLFFILIIVFIKSTNQKNIELVPFINTHIILHIIIIIFFLHSMILFNNILYLEDIGGYFSFMTFFFAVLTICSCILSCFYFFYSKNLINKKPVQDQSKIKHNYIDISILLQILTLFSAINICLRMYIFIFINVINTIFFSILSSAISCCMGIFLLYKSNNFLDK